MSLFHITEVLILNFDSDFILTTLEAQPEWDCKVPESSKQEEGLDIYCAAFGHSSGECGAVAYREGGGFGVFNPPPKF